jgi:hypothetical protein
VRAIAFQSKLALADQQAPVPQHKVVPLEQMVEMVGIQSLVERIPQSVDWAAAAVAVISVVQVELTVAAH